MIQHTRRLQGGLLARRAQSSEVVQAGVLTSLAQVHVHLWHLPAMWPWAQLPSGLRGYLRSALLISQGWLGVGLGDGWEPAETMPGNIRAPYSCTLISDVSQSPWRLCKTFPLPLKCFFNFWHWFQAHKDISNLDSPPCRDMPTSEYHMSSAVQAPVPWPEAPAPFLCHSWETAPYMELCLTVLRDASSPVFSWFPPYLGPQHGLPSVYLECYDFSSLGASVPSHATLKLFLIWLITIPAKYLVYNHLCNICHPLLLQISEAQCYGTNIHVSLKSVGWSCAPKCDGIHFMVGPLGGDQIQMRS